MREIYYAVYKNVDYKTMVMTILAEAIVEKRAEFVRNKFILRNTIGLNRYEKQILTKISLNNVSQFHLSAYHKWVTFLVKECIDKKYLRKIILAGPKPTKYFKSEIKKNMSGFNANIISYIDSKDLKYLLQIDKNLGKVSLPKFKETESAKVDLWRMGVEASYYADPSVM